MKLDLRMRMRFVALTCMVMAPLLGGADGGCGKAVSIGGDDPNGTGGNAGTAGSSGGSGTDAGAACGPVTCSDGLECCNASCGTCVRPGEACDAIACVPECQAQAARGSGACELHLGYGYNGAECVPLSGCSCEGAACDDLFGSIEDCKLAFAECSAGGGGSDCSAQDARGDGPCDAYFGVMWNGIDCVSVSGCECVGTDCDALYPEPDECKHAHETCNIQACAAEDNALISYLQQHTTCTTDSDCRITDVGCRKARHDCSGTFYTNNDVDAGVVSELQAALNACVNGDPNTGCAVCDLASPPAACVSGTCRAQTAQNCPSVASSCEPGCYPMTAFPYDVEAPAGCVSKQPIIVGCTTDDAGTADAPCVQRIHDGSLFIATSGSIFRNSDGWQGCSESDAQKVYTAPTCP